MKERHGESRPNMDCEWNLMESHQGKLKYARLGYEMDVRDLKFDDASFDAAIDKGTMDAMMTVKGDIWVYRAFSHSCFYRSSNIYPESSSTSYR